MKIFEKCLWTKFSWFKLSTWECWWKKASKWLHLYQNDLYISAFNIVYLLKKCTISCRFYAVLTKCQHFSHKCLWTSGFFHVCCKPLDMYERDIKGHCFYACWEWWSISISLMILMRGLFIYPIYMYLSCILRFKSSCQGRQKGGRSIKSYLIYMPLGWESLLKTQRT